VYRGNKVIQVFRVSLVLLAKKENGEMLAKLVLLVLLDLLV
jgi:hypothetical protein